MIQKIESLAAEYDILVAGLGTAGAVALITAARRGCRVLGIEALSAMGGTGTLGGVSGYYFGARGGTYAMINTAVKRLQKKLYARTWGPNCNAKACVLEEAALQYGADILYDARVIQLCQKGKTIYGAHIFSGGKTRQVRAKVIIDCTGEAQICHLAGCACQMGRAFDGQTQPFSNMAITAANHTVASLNKDAGYVNSCDPEDFAQKAVLSAAQLAKLPLCEIEKRQYITNAPLLGIRQGRTIIGEETVTLRGFLSGSETPTPVFYAYANIDHHGKDTAFEDELLLDWYVGAGLWGIYVSVGIPMGALIPKGYSGLLAAGRCLAAEHSIASCIRMKSDMEKCGEAAAEMAALSIESQLPLQKIDYASLAARLKLTGCLDKRNDIGPVKKASDGSLVPFAWLTDPDEILRQLGTIRPGIAIWSAKRLGNHIRPRLRAALQTDDELRKKNVAIALALLDDNSGVAILREMARCRDGFIPATSAAYSYLYGVTAVYLLGRLADQQSVGLLLDMVRSRGQFSSKNFTPDALYADTADAAFHYLSFAIRALKKIVQKHPQNQEEIQKTVLQTIFAKDFCVSVSMKENPRLRQDMTEKLRQFSVSGFAGTSQTEKITFDSIQ